jgi:SAM-dependent methyltransferase
VGNERDFARVARALRDAILEHYHARGEPLTGDAGLRTLDTNSTLVPQRAELLLDLYERRVGDRSIAGLRVADLGCGFGAMSVYLSWLGASVVGLDSNGERFPVGARLADRFRLDISFHRAWLEEMALPEDHFDLAIINNSLCYITDRDDRRRALSNTLGILNPGGWVLLRDPSRSSPIDPFTGLPMVHRFPGWLRRPALRLSERGRARSTVRLMSPRSARRAFRRAGFAEVRSEREASGRRRGRYLHLTARRPDVPES